MFSHGIELENLQNNIPVRIISTPRVDLKVCCADDKILTIIENNIEDYDNFPVVENRDSDQTQIIGLLNVKKLTEDEKTTSTVGEKMERLSEKNLIGADASILSYIESAKSAECRLLISGVNISGMVCLSDLQKLPVRSAIFALITNLEQIMSTLVEYKDCHFEKWKGHLAKNRIELINKRITISKSNHNFISELSHTDFNDKVIILDNICDFDKSQYSLKYDLKRIKELRDKMYHAMDYADTTEEGKNFIAIVELCQKWTKTLSSEMLSGKVSVLPAN